MMTMASQQLPGTILAQSYQSYRIPSRGQKSFCDVCGPSPHHHGRTVWWRFSRRVPIRCGTDTAVPWVIMLMRILHFFWWRRLWDAGMAFYSQDACSCSIGVWPSWPLSGVELSDHAHAYFAFLFRCLGNWPGSCTKSVLGLSSNGFMHQKAGNRCKHIWANKRFLPCSLAFHISYCTQHSSYCTQHSVLSTCNILYLSNQTFVFEHIVFLYIVFWVFFFQLSA